MPSWTRLFSKARLVVLAIAGLVLSLAAAGRTEAQNLVNNGSFRSGSGSTVSGWDGASSVFWDKSFGQDDSYSIRMLSAMPHHPVADSISQTINVNNGSVYRATWWHESEGSSGFGDYTNVGVLIKSGRTTSGGSYQPLLNSDWRQGTEEFTAKDDTAKITFTPTQSNYLTVVLDNISVVLLGAPVLSVAGTTSFGNVLVGQTANQTLTIENSGYAKSILSVNARSGASPLNYSWENFDVVAGNNQNEAITWNPNTRGIALNQAVNVSSTYGSLARTYTGSSVAPVAAVSNHNGMARVGTIGTTTIEVSNFGDGNSAPEVFGSINGVNERKLNDLWFQVSSAGGNFTGAGSSGDASLSDTDGASTYSFTFSGASRGTVSQSIDVDLYNGTGDSNSASTVTQTLIGTMVGPVYSSSVAPSGSIDFGEVSSTQTSQRTLAISNLTTDAGTPQQVGLTLLGYDILGDNPDAFELIGFTPGTRLDKDDVLSLAIQFTAGTSAGSSSATLQLYTDQGAALGGDGEDFQYLLSVITVPEPSALLLALYGAMAVAVCCVAAKRTRRAR